MRQFPSYSTIKNLSIEEQKKALRTEKFRSQVLADEPKLARDRDTNKMISSWDRMFVLPEDLSYEPGYEDSLEGRAAREGISVREALMDAMADGRPILYLFGDYDYTVQPQFDFISRDRSVFGLSDGGAHVGVLCDASVPTYMLAYATRDRIKGPQLPLEFVIHKMSQDTAGVYGLTDRGVIAKGYKADLNVIDYDKIRLHDPEMVFDLPSGGKRLIQKADGYIATICGGVVTYENGVHTGQMPGRLIRGGQTESV